MRIIEHLGNREIIKQTCIIILLEFDKTVSRRSLGRSPYLKNMALLTGIAIPSPHLTSATQHHQELCITSPSSLSSSELLLS
jgi:hypothetical protein